MRIDIFTLFPDMMRGPLDTSIIARARAKEIVEVNLYNPRDVTTDRHHIVDDYPYGGGAGMVMKPDPIFTAVERVYESGPIILMSPQGRVFYPGCRARARGGAAPDAALRPLRRAWTSACVSISAPTKSRSATSS